MNFTRLKLNKKRKKESWDKKYGLEFDIYLFMPPFFLSFFITFFKQARIH